MRDLVAKNKIFISKNYQIKSQLIRDNNNMKSKVTLVKEKGMLNQLNVNENINKVRFKESIWDKDINAKWKK